MAKLQSGHSRSNSSDSSNHITIIFVLTKSMSGGESQAAPETPLSGIPGQVTLVTPAAVPRFTTRIQMMVKQKGRKVVAAVARAAKDKQFKALQQDMGLMSDEDGEEGHEAKLALSTPQKAATKHPVVQFLQQREGGAPGKWASRMDPDLSSLVPIPTSPSHLISLAAHSSGLVGQDAKSVKLPVSPPLSGSPYIKSPPFRPRSGGWDGYLEPCSPLPFKMLDLDFPALEGASLALQDPIVLQARTKTRAQHVAAALAESIEISSIKCVVDFTLCYTMPDVISLQVQDPLIPPPASWPEVHY